MLKEINFTDKLNDDLLISQPETLNIYSGNSLKIENLPSWLPKSDFGSQEGKFSILSEFPE